MASAARSVALRATHAKADFRLRSQVIPSEPGSPGAREANVTRFADNALASFMFNGGALFIVDGSSFVTAGQGQPTMTIQALAFRAAEHMTRLARQGEVRSGRRITRG